MPSPAVLGCVWAAVLNKIGMKFAQPNPTNANKKAAVSSIALLTEPPSKAACSLATGELSPANNTLMSSICTCHTGNFIENVAVFSKLRGIYLV